MMPEVLDAINSTCHDFVNMHELQDKAGAKIAEMQNCKATFKHYFKKILTVLCEDFI